MDANRRFAELARLYWWKFDNPDFTDAREVLRVMREREDYESFRRHLIYTFFDDFYAPVIDTTGKLRDVAIEWMEAEHE